MEVNKVKFAPSNRDITQIQKKKKTFQSLNNKIKQKLHSSSKRTDFKKRNSPRKSLMSTVIEGIRESQDYYQEKKKEKINLKENNNNDNME